ncbi:hypothetical protein GMD78_05365 [Ornithinibacillus sp. L9]|uniref:Lipoprotein n=1 Tax=Ornithinibacillus caprae TaxID=2678566 RepID=A0A6N8FKL0_9BACI|nr:hypothetical protein [Ornithinibacillus caprae]MUK87828.1 hypothetical protein [Ornithinibacillus caprae]
MKYLVLIGSIILLGVIIGCSEEKEAFDDENINIEVKSNTIEIKNESGFDLDNLSLKISYPYDAEKSNNTSAERETVKFVEDFNIRSDKTREISMPLKLKEDGIETINLEIDLKGNVVEGNEKVPFNIGGSLSGLVINP